MERYDHQKVEKKWQKYWLDNQVFKTTENSKSDKYYVLDMFPYPSGVGLHVGHPKGYIATDIISRSKRMQGYEVLHPMGWDAFGLPAENYALKNKVHPSVAVSENVATFKKQLSIIGFDHDWSREINTTDPEYYKWTQWAFVQMFKKGLAFESHEPINWCPSCKTGLANEDLEQGKCERCDSEIEQRPMRQWVLRITDYADRLLEGLDGLDWETPMKEMQRNWIGRSEGATIKFQISDFRFQNEKEEGYLEVFTTRPDTIFGATYMVVAPEHSLIADLKLQIENWEEIENYISNAKKKTELERTDLAKDKTGVELKGVTAINPATGKEIPVWIADYVLAGYGTGAIMAVPAHDGRDYEFAQKYKLLIVQVIAPLHTVKPGDKDMVRADEPTIERDVVYVIVKHWEDGTYLCLDWSHDADWRSFVIGGVDEGESLVDAAVRELKEETGFVNIKSIAEVPLSEVHASFYASHKSENRYGRAQAVYVELEDGTQEEVSDEEKAKHDLVWLEHDKVCDYQAFSNHKHVWNVHSGVSTVYTEDGVLVNSDFLNGLSVEEAKTKIVEWLEKEGCGKQAITYRLKDWAFSRQRYWGEPIPIIHCDACGPVAVPEADLPVVLPDVEHYEPTDTGESPLANITDWVNVACPECGGKGKRETNTMPQWAGSCWYYLRYIDPDNTDNLVNKDKEKYWSPVDLYVGGAEHATRHLIYARFWHKFLFDIGAVSCDEPFIRLQHVGLILAEDGRKMSKRWGNVVNPDEIVEVYGADTLRIYEMFIGPFGQAVSWSTENLMGARRFLDRIYSLQYKVKKDYVDSREVVKVLHQTIKKVTEDISRMHFNTAIAQMMILSNLLEKQDIISRNTLEKFILVLSPYTPHISEEIWSELGHNNSITRESWPNHDSELIQEEEIELVVQVNGKVRDKFTVLVDASEADIKNKIVASENIQKYLGGKEPKNIIFIKGKLVNIVI